VRSGVSLSLCIATLSSCVDLASEDKRRFSYYFYEAQARKKEALALIENNPEVIAYIASRPTGRWQIDSDVGSTIPEEPFFCPGEYYAGYWDRTNPRTRDTEPNWRINIRVNKLIKEPSDQEDIPRYRHQTRTEDGDRIKLCLDGKTPVTLRPSVFTGGG
jgi:hypothetical protein